MSRYATDFPGIVILTPCKQFGPIKISYCWFAERPEPLRGQLRIYKQAKATHGIAGFRRTLFATKMISLAPPPKALIQGFDKDTAYDVRRSERDGTAFVLHADLASAELFYNDFAATKGLASLGSRLRSYGSYLQVTKAVHESETLVMHYYLLDEKQGRVRLLHSASQYRGKDEPAVRQKIGRANRFLHLGDMLHYKELGFSEFDLGGYAYPRPTPELARINAFKDGFGGRLIEESDYVPFWMKMGASLKTTTRSPDAGE